MNSTHAGVFLRAVDPDSPELRPWMTMVSRGLKESTDVTSELMDLHRPTYRTQRLTGAFDSDDIVATFRSWDLGLTVPGGGSVPANAISSVSVAPTHRRRGLLTAMMTADLAEAARRRVPAALLIASEAGIYGRFGFAAATEAATWALDLRATRFRPDLPPDPGRCRIVEADQLRVPGTQVYARSRRAGAIDRTDVWWDLALGLVAQPGEKPRQHIGVIHSDADGQADGLLLYRVEESWPDRMVHTTVHVTELLAATPQAYRALWRYLGELDLVATVRAEDRPVDEAVPALLTDPRAVRQTARCDFQWTRLLDPAAALSARTYQAPGRCVFEVADPQGWAGGRFLLEAAPDGTGRCGPTTRDAELTLTVQTLSALWLGGGDLDAAVLAGDAVEHRPGAARRLAVLLRTFPAPWTSTWF